MFDRRLLSTPAAPDLPGLFGDLQALAASLQCAGIAADTDILAGIAGLAFSFGFRSTIATEADPSHPQFAWFVAAPFDGPDPLRLAARFAGCDYTPHLVNSLSSMVERIQQSIDAGFAVLAHHPAAPHPITLVVGYRIADPYDRSVDIVERKPSGESAVRTVPLPADPSASWVEFGPWRNFSGVITRRHRPTEDDRRRQTIAALRRAVAVCDATTTRTGGYRALIDAVSDANHPHARTVNQMANDLSDLARARHSAQRFLMMADEIHGLPTAPIAARFGEVADALGKCRDRVASRTSATATTAADATAEVVEDADLAAAIAAIGDAESAAFMALAAISLD